jgi:Protein of unknown function (DUF992)
MRWWMVVVLPVCAGFSMVPGSSLSIEIGVLSCTLGGAIHTQVSDNVSGAGEAREMLCSFSPAKNGPEETYAGALKSINGVGPLPEKTTMLWVVRAPIRTRPTVGLLQQSYSADSATPAGQAAPLVGERDSEITLHSMSDKEEGSASKEKQSVPQFTITAIELKLRATTS